VKEGRGEGSEVWESDEGMSERWKGGKVVRVDKEGRELEKRKARALLTELTWRRAGRAPWASTKSLQSTQSPEREEGREGEGRETERGERDRERGEREERQRGKGGERREGMGMSEWKRIYTHKS
jgi:hypothetical protein